MPIPHMQTNEHRSSQCWELLTHHPVRIPLLATAFAYLLLKAAAISPVGLSVCLVWFYGISLNSAMFHFRRHILYVEVHIHGAYKHRYCKNKSKTSTYTQPSPSQLANHFKNSLVHSRDFFSAKKLPSIFGGGGSGGSTARRAPQPPRRAR